MCASGQDDLLPREGERAVQEFPAASCSVRAVPRHLAEAHKQLIAGDANISKMQAAVVHSLIANLLSDVCQRHPRECLVVVQISHLKRIVGVVNTSYHSYRKVQQSSTNKVMRVLD